MNDDTLLHEIDVRVARLEEYRVSAEKALAIQQDSLLAYKQSANEWRNTVSDITGKHITRMEAQALLDRLTDRIAALEKQEHRSEGKSSGIGISWGVVVAVAMFVLGMVTLLAALKGHP